MARRLRRQFEGALYHLVVRGTARQRLFHDDHDRKHYLELLDRYRNQFGVRIYAYVLMNRRIQLLLETPRGNVSKLMQCLGTSYASYFNRRYRRKGSLYAGRYRSYLLFDRKRLLLEATRYIHRIPHGSRLERHRDHPWSSYRAYLGWEESTLVDPGPALSQLGDDAAVRVQRYREFAEGPATAGSYRALVRSQGSRGVASGDSADRKSASLKKAHQILRDVRLSLRGERVPSPARRKKRAIVHHVAMYLIRKQTQLSLNVIGRLLGVKAPAVALAIGRLEKSLKVGELPGTVRSLLRAEPLSAGDERRKR